MKRILLVIAHLLIGLSLSAQIKIVAIDRDADVLMFTFSSGMDVINVYKNSKGYFLAEESTNMFDSFQRFYLGGNTEETIASLTSLISFCDEDVATKFTIQDAVGNEFLVVTDIGTGGYKRKPTPQKSNMVRIRNNDMAGWMCYRKKALEEIISILSK